MVGLIDIVPLVERMTIRGKEVEVHGIDLTQLGQLIWEFPEFRRLYETRQLTAAALLGLGTPMVAKLIALACPGRIDEGGARNLAPGEQAEIVARIFKITMPTGIGPFVQVMEAIGGPVAVQSALASVTNSGTPPSSSEPMASPMQ
jgi:hypothetical protein